VVAKNDGVRPPLRKVGGPDLVRVRQRASPYLPIGGDVGPVIGLLRGPYYWSFRRDNSDIHFTQDPSHKTTVTIGEATKQRGINRVILREVA